MKNKFHTIFFLLLITSIYCKAQVACDATLLTDVTDFCSKDAEYTNVGATPSGFTPANCWTNKSATQDIWYKLNAIGTDLAVSVSGGGAKGTIKNPNISILTGDCAGTMTEHACANGVSNITQIYNAGMIPGTLYYIRISTTTANAGTFTLCVNNTTPTANPGADCDGGVKLCSKNAVSVPGLKGGGKDNDETKSDAKSCLAKEENSCWYYWVCEKSGTLTFSLTPIDPKRDIDFNFYSIANGTDICKNRKVERCSSSSCIVGDGSTGLNMTETDIAETDGCDPATQNAFVKYVDMVAGTTYAILVNNADDQSGFSISFGGTGTFQGPVAEITTDKIAICPGKEITYDGTKSTNYTKLEWNFISGGTPTAAAGAGPHVIKYNTAGNYVGILKATDNLGCNSVSAVNITVIGPIPITVTSDTICSGEVATLTAFPNIPGAIYNWSPAPATGNGTPTITTNPATTQTYTVSCEKNGCINTATGIVYIKSDVIIAAVPPVNICIGNSVTLIAAVSGGSANYTYNWLPAGTGNTASVSVSPINSQDYTVTVTDNTNGGGCPPAPLIIKVTVNPPLKVDALGADTICVGSSVTLSSIASGGNGGPYTYTWQPASITGQVVSVSPVITTTYTITVTDNCGTPAALDSVKVTVAPTPVVKFTAPDALGCAGPLCVNFIDSSITSQGIINKWEWNFGTNPSGTAEGASDIKNPVHCFATSSQYTISLTVTNSFGCKATGSKVNTIFIAPKSSADFSAPVSISIQNPEVSFINTSVGGATYSWNFGDLVSGINNTSTLLNPTHTYSSIGKYAVKLIITTANNCVDSIIKYITVDPLMILYIPNAFSPNGDGINDTFFAKGEYIYGFQMRIFDRWGNMVFYSADIEKHWDGKIKSNGLIAQQDVYVYDVRVKDIKNATRKYNGIVTLIK